VTRDQAASLTRSRSSGSKPFFRQWMPYLFQRIEHPGHKHVYLPLNRDYVPFGHEGRADYEAYGRSHGVVFRRDPATFTGIWWNVDQPGGRLWLYDDSAASRQDYFARFERLMLKANHLVGKVAGR
jgi:hypothetical protein